MAIWGESVAESAEGPTHTELADLQSLPSTQIGNVNIITGHFIDFEKDLTIMGAVPLVFERSKDNSGYEGELSGGWNHNFVSRIYLKKSHTIEGHKHNHKYCDLKYTGPHGEELRFVAKKNSHTMMRMPVDPVHYEYALTNCASGKIGGRTHLRNHEVILRQDDKNCTIKKGDGSELHFTVDGKSKAEFRLVEEVFPNGNRIHYSPGKFIAQNRAGKALNSLRIHKISEAETKVYADDGRCVTYRYEPHHVYRYKQFVRTDWALSQVIRPNAPDITYELIKNKKHQNGWVIGKRLPEDRFLRFEYYVRDKETITPEGEKIKIKDDDDVRLGKVRCIKAPIGSDNTPHTQHQFVYKREKHKAFKDIGSTYVWDAKKHKTIYRHKNQRIVAIEHLCADNITPYSTEKFEWGPEDSELNCNLMRHLLEDPNGSQVYEKTYKYDGRHNVVEECLYGNICGLGQRDCLKKTSSYSEEGKNLLLAQEDGEKTVVLSYCPGTDLIRSKIITGFDGLRIRYFYEYNEEGVKTVEIVDDGTGKDVDDLSGVSERRIRRVEPVARGLPGCVIESYIDGDGQEIRLRKEINTYSAIGRLIKQENYDANDTFLFTLHWKYDANGNVTKESDALGQVTERLYDANNNLIFEQGPDKSFARKWAYDFMNRVIRLEEIHADKTLTTHYSYDRRGNKIREMDIYGNVNQFAYDCRNRLVKTISPKVRDINGSLTPIVNRKNYGLLGNLTAEIDGSGHAIRYTNSILGSVCRKEYPDGSFEEFEYSLHNRVIKKRGRNGLITHYAYDSLGRLCMENAGDLAIKTAKHSAFHLLSETDPSGLTTYYEYDRAGRKIAERKGRETTYFAYDAQSRLIQATTATQTIKVSYDLLNRIIEEKTVDSYGTLLSHIKYGYDAAGRRVHSIKLTEEGALVEEKEFNSKGDLILCKDAVGQITRNIYHYNYVNESGQRVPCHETIDPLGNRLITVMDALGRVVSLEQRDAKGQQVLKRDFHYDERGNRVGATEHVMVKGEVVRTVLNEWQWDCMNQLTAVIEGAGSTEAKRTGYRYNIWGQKEAIIKPDGNKIAYAYDLLGRVIRLEAPHIIYAYTYDVMNRPVEVRDLVSHQTTCRRYDSEHHLIEEKLANNLTVEYDYDDTGALISMTLPFGNKVHYSYRGGRLQTISRRDEAGCELYQAAYQYHDLTGNIKQLTLPGNLEVVYTYDGLSRVTSIQTPQWSQTACEYDGGGNLKNFYLTEPSGLYERHFVYDSLGQLTSEEGEFTHHYQHDSLYNLVAKDGEIFNYNALNQPQTEDQEFDLNGNLICKKALRLHYDALDRLIEVEEGNCSFKYSYDPFNRRMAKNGQLFLYQGDNEIGSVEEGVLTQLRILGQGKGAEIGASIAFELKGLIYSPVHDHNGNIAALYHTATQELSCTYHYSAFGELKGEKQVDNPWLYASKRVDEETGFSYFGKRYYDPATHRWITADPLKFDGGTNLYAYVQNNPLTHLDLFGLFAQSNQFSFMEAFGSMVSLVGQVMCYPGRLVEHIGSNWVPIPYLRDFVEGAGRVFSGRNIGEWTPSSKQNYTEVGTFQGTNGEEGVIHYLVNGINTSRKEFMQHVEDYSKAMGGATVHYTYNGSKGVITDLIECVHQKLGISTPPDRAMKKHLEYLIDINGGVESNVIVLCQAHSQGGLITNNVGNTLSPAYASKIHVRTIGSASIIPQGNFASVQNYVCPTDMVPYTDSVGLISAMQKNDGTLRFIKPSTYSPADHLYGGKPYSWARNKIRNEFQKLINMRNQ